jgi:DNA-binding transcriptional LysR family regulator
MGRVRDGAPSQWDCVVFSAVAKFKNKNRAVDYLFTEYGETISTKGVENILKKIDSWLKENTFEESSKGTLELTLRGKRFLRFANKIVASYQEERTPTTRRTLPKIVCLPHHVYITSRLECDLREQHPNHEDQILVEELRHSDLGDDDFEDDALFPLTLGHHEIVIGGKTATYEQEFQSDLLYRAQLEVMVPAGFQRDQMDLAELVNGYRALLPPEGAHARKLLEDWIARTRIDTPTKDLWVVAGTHEITMSVQRASDDHHRFGEKSQRVVVAPSDVALLYKPGARFGGEGVDASKWVPLQHEDDYLELDVCVTTTNPRPNHLRTIVETLKTICDENPQLSGRRVNTPAPRKPAMETDHGHRTVRTGAARRRAGTHPS